MNVLLIDNIDSFTWNLAQLVEGLGVSCHVVCRDAVNIQKMRRRPPDRIIISPGPGNPKECEESLQVIRAFSHSVPILGVCLGHQCLAHVFGGVASVARSRTCMHGKTSAIHHDGSGIFRGIPTPFIAARYHSLVVKKIPKEFLECAWTEYRGAHMEVMAMRHKSLPLFGVQFHPESFLTEYGEKLMQNFLQRKW